VLLDWHVCLLNFYVRSENVDIVPLVNLGFDIAYLFVQTALTLTLKHFHFTSILLFQLNGCLLLVANLLLL